MYGIPCTCKHSFKAVLQQTRCVPEWPSCVVCERNKEEERGLFEWFPWDGDIRGGKLVDYFGA